MAPILHQSIIKDKVQNELKEQASLQDVCTNKIDAISVALVVLTKALFL
jgi:hypothetical protein